MALKSTQVDGTAVRKEFLEERFRSVAGHKQHTNFFDTFNFFAIFESNRHVADAASIRNPDASSVAYVPTAAKEDTRIFDTFNFFCPLRLGSARGGRFQRP